jgi:glyceraldehyde-3-phosphate dehydrogenase/erythrose-4-phosphate dehydrogenase
MAIKVGINGFGRIGRLVYKAIRERYNNEFDVVAVNDIGRIEIMAHLPPVRFELWAVSWRGRGSRRQFCGRRR